MVRALSVEVTVLPAEDGDTQDLPEAVAALAARFAELPIEALRLPRSEAPPDSKSGLGWSSGEIVLSVLSSSGLLAAVVQIAQARLGDRRVRKLRLELDGDALELEGASKAQQEALIRQWLDRHADGN